LVDGDLDASTDVPLAAVPFAVNITAPALVLFMLLLLLLLSVLAGRCSATCMSSSSAARSAAMSGGLRETLYSRKWLMRPRKRVLGRWSASACAKLTRVSAPGERKQ
jgi:hypothetical protein